MSLLDEFSADCVIINRNIVNDGYGGYVTTWAEGAEFKAAITFASSIQARQAEKQGVTSLYSVYTDKSITLQYHDVFKRLSDNKIFRVTSDGDDEFTPESSPLNKRRVNAEEYTLTEAVQNG
ncbi:MAG: hypothetical protein II453_10665 [Alphaproteobacteria bacterium]|nr:hypothetical protein [Alphaproteobacteria bacterium]